MPRTVLKNTWTRGGIHWCIYTYNQIHSSPSLFLLFLFFYFYRLFFFAFLLLKRGVSPQGAQSCIELFTNTLITFKDVVFLFQFIKLLISLPLWYIPQLQQNFSLKVVLWPHPIAKLIWTRGGNRGTRAYLFKVQFFLSLFKQSICYILLSKGINF